MTGTAWQYQDRVATAFDEVGVLEEMGRWELRVFEPAEGQKEEVKVAGTQSCSQ